MKSQDMSANESIFGDEGQELKHPTESGQALWLGARGGTVDGASGDWAAYDFSG